MRNAAVLLRLGLVVLVMTALPLSASAGSKDGGYQTGFTKWAGSDLSGFSGPGVSFDGTQLMLDLAGASAETDPGGMYNGGTYEVGEALGPVLPVSFAFTEAIASWNATTPDGTWVEVLLRAQLGGQWSKWYNMGVWASNDKEHGGAIDRHSVRSQGDTNGYVATDTLVLTAKKVTADALQLRVRLFSANDAVPSIQGMSLTFNSAPPKKWGISPSSGPIPALDVPQCSQMIYLDGGNVWCSPTSTSMVLGYWEKPATYECEPRVRAAVNGVYDFAYQGHGNWPFNTAYAAAKGMEAYVVRYAGLDKVEPWVKAGIPVVVSYAWGKGELTGAPIASSSGHLGVIVGFDAQGNPIVNDPAAAGDGEVRRVYLRSEFEPLWLGNSAGTVYLIFPRGSAHPAL